MTPPEKVGFNPGIYHRLVGLVVKASASGAEDPEFDSRLRRGNFSGSSHTSTNEQTGWTACFNQISTYGCSLPRRKNMLNDTNG